MPGGVFFELVSIAVFIDIGSVEGSKVSMSFLRRSGENLCLIDLPVVQYQCNTL